jgi:hypothetical protein
MCNREPKLSARASCVYRSSLVHVDVEVVVNTNITIFVVAANFDTSHI